MLLQNRRRPFIQILYARHHVSLRARPVILQPLLAALQRNFARLQIALRQVRRQHGVLAGEDSHGVDMLDDKLAVRHPQAHIFQVLGVEARLLHRLIERVEERVVRLIDLHTLPGQLLRLLLRPQQQPQCILIGFQRVVGVLTQQPALPLRPQPQHAAEGDQAAHQRVHQARQ